MPLLYGSYPNTKLKLSLNATTIPYPTEVASPDDKITQLTIRVFKVR